MTYGNGGGWRVDAGALGAGGKTQFFWPYNLTDDDMVGGVTSRSGYCMALRTTRYVAVLLNRSPSADTITLDWNVLGLDNNVRMAVRDVWAGADRGSFASSFNATVPSHGTALLVLSPSAK